MADKVRYIGVSDTQVQWGGNDDPRGILIEGELYILHHLEKHDWYTKYILEVYPDKKFNSVSFEKVG